MTREEAEAALEATSALITRALAVASGAPNWKFVANEEFAQLSLDGDEATLIWPENETSYDLTTVGAQTFTFPVELLFIDEAAFVAWKADARAQYDRKHEDEKRKARQAVEAQERATFEALKRKYG